MKKLIIIAALLFSCASTVPKPDPATVQVFFNPPGYQYKVLGTIAESDEDYDDMIEALQEKVLSMGGNALIVQQQGKKADNGAIVGSNDLLIGSSGGEDLFILALVIKLQ